MSFDNRFYIDQLDIEPRIYNLLKRNKIDTRLKAIRLCNKPKGKRPYGFGRKTIVEIQYILEDIKDGYINFE
jgi:hypothetical protein